MTCDQLLDYVTLEAKELKGESGYIVLMTSLQLYLSPH